MVQGESVCHSLVFCSHPRVESVSQAGEATSESPHPRQTGTIGLSGESECQRAECQRGRSAAPGSQLQNEVDRTLSPAPSGDKDSGETRSSC